MKIQSHDELEVFQLAFKAAQQIFEASKIFPKEERYSLTDQIRRSSRSVCANLAEAFRKRKYPAYFIAKLIDSEAEAAETQVWLRFSIKCEYVDEVFYKDIVATYDLIIGKLVTMRTHPESWTL